MTTDDFWTEGDTGESLRGAPCGARVCSVDYTHGPHRHGDGVVYLDAPAGSPLHEQADRDADKVPSDRVRAYADAMCRVAHFDGWSPPVAIPNNQDPRYRVAACFQCQKAARACAAVEDRRIARVEDRISVYAANPDDEWAGRLIAEDFADALRGPEPTEETQ